MYHRSRIVPVDQSEEEQQDLADALQEKQWIQDIVGTLTANSIA
jgi:hypothetical protein